MQSKFGNELCYHFCMVFHGQQILETVEESIHVFIAYAQMVYEDHRFHPRDAISFSIILNTTCLCSPLGTSSSRAAGIGILVATLKCDCLLKRNTRIIHYSQIEYLCFPVEIICLLFNLYQYTYRVN